MLAIDQMIGELVAAAGAIGEEKNTYVVFSSDNGLHMGEHRMMPGKQTAYETDIHVPLLIRGPGVAAGVTRDELVMETDLAPTFAAWGRASAPSFVDGRSLAPLLAGAVTEWRNAVLIEHFSGSTEPFASDFEETQRRGRSRIPTYRALRTRDATYVEYETGERELYDLGRDPLELDNAYPHADRARIDRLARQLHALQTCSGATCRAAEVMAH